MLQELALACARLLHCVDVGGELVMFFAGTQHCFQWFQYPVAVVLAVLCCVPVSVFLVAVRSRAPVG